MSKFIKSVKSLEKIAEKGKVFSKEKSIIFVENKDDFDVLQILLCENCPNVICQEKTKFFREMYRHFRDPKREECYCPTWLVLLNGMDVLYEDLKIAENYEEMAERMNLSKF